MVDFEDIPNRDGGKVERNSEGGRPSGLGAYNNGSQGMNIPPILASHLGRSENDPTSCVTPFVHWIEDYPLLDRLKMPSYVGSYDGTRDPDNYLHLFEGAIRMQKWVMPPTKEVYKDAPRGAQHQAKRRQKTRAFVTRYTDDTLQILGLHEDHRISGFVHGLRTRNLVEFLSTNLLTTYKVLMEKTYTWIEAREVATNGAPNGRREGFNISRKNPSYRFFSYRGSNHGMLSNLSKSPREILATEKVVKTFEQPPRLSGSRRSRDMSKYYHFHEDHGHDTNQCRELRRQIEETVKSGQLAHLVKGIKKGKSKAFDTQLGEWKKGDKDTPPLESLILMISRDNRALKRKSVEESVDGVWKITFPSVSSINSSDLVIIKARISERQLVGFSGQHSWPLGEVPLEITIGDSPYARTEILNFVIVRSNSPHNLLLERTAMQRMGIVVKTTVNQFQDETTRSPKVNADVFAWTYAHITGIPRTIMVGRKPFNTEHRLNEFKHIELVRQKKRSLAPERNEAMRKKVEELTKANILREVK
ncbi:hypothetical protein Tco_0601737 [Tanacetum coccineum]